MLLSFYKRLLMIRVLPKTGSIDGQIRCKELFERLKNLTDEHKQEIDYSEKKNGDFTYNSLKDSPKEFELSESEIHVLKRGVNLLDEQNLVTMELLDLCKEISEM